MSFKPFDIIVDYLYLSCGLVRDTLVVLLIEGIDKEVLAGIATNRDHQSALSPRGGLWLMARAPYV
jgi:hypothetical protein